MDRKSEKHTPLVGQTKETLLSETRDWGHCWEHEPWNAFRWGLRSWEDVATTRDATKRRGMPLASLLLSTSGL